MLPFWKCLSISTPHQTKESGKQLSAPLTLPRVDAAVISQLVKNGQKTKRKKVENGSLDDWSKGRKILVHVVLLECSPLATHKRNTIQLRKINLLLNTNTKRKLKIWFLLYNAPSVNHNNPFFVKYHAFFTKCIEK